ncbi:cell wall-binding repeat-containing protein [Peptostreptococcus sp. D1]|uniref:cell wall-binding repeat-containing protein n=1 Tax=Peptostreptococcus sp. D1 TaxID=72304 RepID=UPI0008DF0F83|nr:cell wall-binding repeat-containing protein [Peptostreptococcus sp. D1]SFE72155.1 Leucine-rich repeat (LRR) protein [Peptostreptococcus sp. D1]
MPLFFGTGWTQNKVIKISGVDRYETAAKISEYKYRKGGMVLIASGETPFDAISSGPLVIQEKGIILLVKENEIPKTIEKELERVSPDKLVLVGGENTISKKTENELRKYGSIVRLDGKDRYETSKKIKEYKENINKNSNKVGVASGNNYVDALVSAPFLGSEGSLILTAENIIEENISYVFGGEKSIVGYTGANRFAGIDRYETSIKVAEEITKNQKNMPIIIASGEAYPDALSASTISSDTKYPIVLVKKNEIPASVEMYIRSHKPTKVYIIGGENSISEKCIGQINKLIEKGEASRSNITIGVSGSNNTQTNRDENEKVIFGDERVKAEVKKAFLDKVNLIDISKVIKKEDIVNFEPTIKAMRNLRKLDVSNIFDDNFDAYYPKTIKGIEEAVNLESLHMTGLRSADINRISKLTKLRELNISRNEIDNADFVNKLTNLEKLIVTNNKLKNLDFIKNNKKIKVLTATSNNLDDINGVSELANLEELRLNDNKIDDVTPIKNLKKLIKIDLSGNQIKSIDNIGEKPELEELYLTGDYVGPFEEPQMTGNCIENIKPLAEMKKLKILYLQDLRLISDLKPLSGLKSLQQLTVRNNKISDVTPLSNLTNLKWLHLYKNNISDISSLSNLTELIEFNFAVNRIENIDVVRNMKKLATLMGYENKITDISPIMDLDTLENSLSVPDDLGSDMESIGMVNLTRNKIVDHSPISSIFSKDFHGRYSFVMERAKAELENISYEENGNSSIISVENPLKGPDGSVITEIFMEEKEINEDEVNEIKDFYSYANGIIGKQKEDNIQIEAIGNVIKITIPKEKVKDGRLNVMIPYEKIYYTEDFERDPFSGVLEMNINITN